MQHRGTKKIAPCDVSRQGTSQAKKGSAAMLYMLTVMAWIEINLINQPLCFSSFNFVETITCYHNRNPRFMLSPKQSPARFIK
jgi:hypothetical protein